MDLIEVFQEVWFTFTSLVAQIWVSGPMEVALKFVPFALFIEMPVQITIMLGVLKWAVYRDHSVPLNLPYYPRVSCVILCYAEGAAVASTIRSLAEQIYPGHIELLIVVDGSSQNRATLEVSNAMVPEVTRLRNRSIKVLPKLQRGGRVSGCNLGLELATR